MVDDDVTLEYDVVDGLAGPDELGRRPTHKPRLHSSRVVSASDCGQRRRNGGGARPRNVETTGARVSFRPWNIFPHLHMLFLKLPLFVVMCHTQLVLQAYPTYKACLCHKQDGKLLRVL